MIVNERRSVWLGALAMLLVFSGLVYGWSSLDAAWQREYVSEGDYVRMSQEIVHSAKIEGQELDHDSVRSSVARQLGLSYGGLPVPDHFTEGVVQVMIDATQHYDRPLDAERLFNWHAALFPTGRSGMYKITVGAWRCEGGAMQVVSGPMGHEQVHYEAPDNKTVPAMMNQFLSWVNATDDNIDPLVKAAVAHLWFVTIHPFDDGNGRLCRTITEMLLSRADQTRQRYYSLSSVFLSNRKEYYNHLEQAQKGKACAQAAQESHYATEADLDLMAPQTVSGPEEIVMNGEKKHLWEEMSRLVDTVSWEMFIRYNGIDGDDTKCSYTQIAHEFGYSIGEVKQRIEKTRRILQRNPELNRYYHKSHDRNMRRLGNISMSFLPSTSDLKGYGMGGASVEACSFSDADDEDGAVTIEFDA